MKIKICDGKESPEMRAIRIAETENGRKFREKHIQSKKVYNRKSKYWAFSFL